MKAFLALAGSSALAIAAILAAGSPVAACIYYGGWGVTPLHAAPWDTIYVQPGCLGDTTPIRVFLAPWPGRHGFGEPPTWTPPPIRQLAEARPEPSLNRVDREGQAFRVPDVEPGPYAVVLKYPGDGVSVQRYVSGDFVGARTMLHVSALPATSTTLAPPTPSDQPSDGAQLTGILALLAGMGGAAAWLWRTRRGAPGAASRAAAKQAGVSSAPRTR